MNAFRTALIAFRRAPLLSALSITTIAFSLFAFGLFGLVAVNIKNALLRVEERVEIRAFVADRTTIEQLTLASDDIAKFPEVLRVDVVSQAQALERARRELGEFRDVFEAEFLPASLDVKLKPGALAIGAGNPDGAPPVDFTGAPRGSPVDIGAYQYRPGK